MTTTSLSNQRTIGRPSSVGAGRKNKSLFNGNHSSGSLHHYYYYYYSLLMTNVLTPIMTYCSLAWEPRHRAKSSVAVLFLSLLLLIVFTEKDASAWTKVRLIDQDAKENDDTNNSILLQQSYMKNNDPLDGLTLEQRYTLLSRIYGTWGFYDGSSEDRPTDPYVTVDNSDIYLDVKAADFPEESWQVDAVYVNHFLDAATKLVRRGQEGIFATYAGHGIVNVSVEELDNDVYGEVWDHDARLVEKLRMFRLEEIDLSEDVTSMKELNDKIPNWHESGGWTTSRSMDGLERRFLHAMMTNSNFTIVVTGNWQSMGYGGNHGWQSMGGVLDHLLRGMFDKLGMNLVVRSIGLPPRTGISTEERADILAGGRSTLESSLGWSSIYGSDVDMVVWDDYSASLTGTTANENREELDDTAKELFDFFARQALLSGNANIPFIWGGDFEVLRNLHEVADADVGMLGNGMSGVRETTSDQEAVTLPWAAQYLNCPQDMEAVCNANGNKFMSQCWDSSLKSTPPIPQTNNIPVLPTALGWRMHQLKGYTLSYNILSVILDALDLWSEKTIIEGHPLDDENWHMGEHITNIQTKIKALSEKDAPHCYKLKDKLNLPTRMCNQRLQGRTEYTPRANPADTSLKSIVNGASPNYDIPALFEGESWENPIAKLPSYAVDTLEILELGKQKRRELQRSENAYPKRLKERQLAIETGDGWKIVNSFPQSDCNGSYLPSSSCGRTPTSTCLMEGHHGSRGYMSGDESSGWLSMIISNLESGYIAIAVNIQIGDDHDNTKSLKEKLPDSFNFFYAIDEELTPLPKPQFIEKIRMFNGFGLITILDDSKKTGSDLKVSVRLSGCPKDDGCRLNVSHLYWA